MATKEFGAAVPEEEYFRFQQRFGGFYGATKWFITNALQQFNDRVEKEPTLVLQIQQSIEQMVQRAREEEITFIPGIGMRKGSDPITPEDWEIILQYRPKEGPLY